MVNLLVVPKMRVAEGAARLVENAVKLRFFGLKCGAVGFVDSKLRYGEKSNLRSLRIL